MICDIMRAKRAALISNKRKSTIALTKATLATTTITIVAMTMTILRINMASITITIRIISVNHTVSTDSNQAHAVGINLFFIIINKDTTRKLNLSFNQIYNDNRLYACRSNTCMYYDIIIVAHLQCQITCSARTHW